MNIRIQVKCVYLKYLIIKVMLIFLTLKNDEKNSQKTSKNNQRRSNTIKKTRQNVPKKLKNAQKDILKNELKDGQEHSKTFTNDQKHSKQNNLILTN